MSTDNIFKKILILIIIMKFLFIFLQNFELQKTLNLKFFTYTKN